MANSFCAECDYYRRKIDRLMDRVREAEAISEELGCILKAQENVESQVEKKWRPKSKKKR